jgi:hypothetical protein
MLSTVQLQMKKGNIIHSRSPQRRKLSFIPERMQHPLARIATRTKITFVWEVKLNVNEAFLLLLFLLFHVSQDERRSFFRRKFFLFASR